MDGMGWDGILEGKGGEWQRKAVFTRRPNLVAHQRRLWGGFFHDTTLSFTVNTWRLYISLTDEIVVMDPDDCEFWRSLIVILSHAMPCLVTSCCAK